MANINRDNFNTAGTLLTRSTASRSGTPDGNVYIDTTNDLIELIDDSELATTSAETNGLNTVDKVDALALYFFLLQEVEADSALQNFRFAMDAVGNRMGKLVGATAFLNSIKLAGTDRLKVSNSGFTEFAAGSGGNTIIDRIYHGARSVNDINSTTQPFYMLAESLSEAHRQAATPVDFANLGSINEVIQSFGTTANGDAGAGNFDYKNYVLILGAREFGYTIGEANSNGAELGALSQGYGIGNSIVTELSGITEADVFGGSQVAPYTGLGFTRQTTASTETGFNEGNGLFTDKITTTGGASLMEISA